MFQKTSSGSISKQSGATLIIALIILVIMSMIGISNMQSSTMQERMASNNRQKNLALQAAESALRAAEGDLRVNVVKTEDLSKFDGSDGRYSAVNRSPGEAAVPLAIDVNTVTAWDASGVAQELSTYKVSSKAPRYVIEYLGRDVGASGRKVTEIGYVNTENTDPYVFRITAIGWGKDENIYAVVESTYRTGYGDDFVY
ncbi:type IV pilus assembly protein PilX [Alteromonadaceae bacterium Bs31]|nr:type IV pilus assembly protein PilX [Alteromonadaceae bacterium Bs31]